MRAHFILMVRGAGKNENGHTARAAVALQDLEAVELRKVQIKQNEIWLELSLVQQPQGLLAIIGDHDIGLDRGPAHCFPNHQDIGGIVLDQKNMEHGVTFIKLAISLLPPAGHESARFDGCMGFASNLIRAHYSDSWMNDRPRLFRVKYSRASQRPPYKARVPR